VGINTSVKQAPTVCHDREMGSKPVGRDGVRPVSRSSIRRLLISRPDARLRDDRTAVRVAILTGVIFFFAGLVKFVFHHWELHAFRSFGLPWPSALEIFAGALETGGGVLLMQRRCVAPVAVLLSITMIVAIGSSGIGEGDVIPSLTLAPLLLLAMIYLLRVVTAPRPRTSA
jgi:uncharacterized membrane protein YphA (DoxX/SURF4 family)